MLETLKKGLREVPANIKKDVQAIPGNVKKDIKEVGTAIKGRAKSAKDFMDTGGLSPAQLYKKGKEIERKL